MYVFNCFLAANTGQYYFTAAREADSRMRDNTSYADYKIRLFCQAVNANMPASDFFADPYQGRFFIPRMIIDFVIGCYF